MASFCLRSYLQVQQAEQSLSVQVGQTVGSLQIGQVIYVQVGQSQGSGFGQGGQLISSGLQFLHFSQLFSANSALSVNFLMAESFSLMVLLSTMMLCLKIPALSCNIPQSPFQLAASADSSLFLSSSQLCLIFLRVQFLSTDIACPFLSISAEISKRQGRQEQLGFEAFRHPFKNYFAVSI